MWQEHRERALHEGLITAIAVGGTLILLGVVALSPSFLDNAQAFISDFTANSIPFGSANIVLPYPATPSAHIALFTSALYFIVGIAILQIVILPLRLAFKSPMRRIAETVGNLVFWVGAAIAAQAFLLAGTVAGWFQFWSALIVLVGVSLIARGLVHFSGSLTHRSDACC